MAKKFTLNILKAKDSIVFLLFLLSSFFCSFSSHAQSDPKLLFTIDTPAVFVTLDNLDNIFVVTEKNQVLKYDASGKLLWNYSNKAFGKLGYLDTTDPMRILLFYPAIQQVVVLNNTLNEISRFNIGTDASRQIGLVAAANSNGYWIYDQQDRILRKLGNQFNDERLSGNIYQQTGVDVQPVFMLANDQYVFLSDPKKGIFVFDRFGTYARTLEIGSVKSFQVKNSQLLFFQRAALKAYDLRSNSISSIAVFNDSVLQVNSGTKLLAVLTKEGIKVYDNSVYEKQD